MQNVSKALSAATVVCVRDLYSGKDLSPLAAGAPLEATLGVHDSGLYCVWPAAAAIGGEVSVGTGAEAACSGGGADCPA